MRTSSSTRTLLSIALLALAACGIAAAGNAGRALPDPALDPMPPNSGNLQVAVLAGGCFWGMQAVFEHVRGVLGVTAGFSGGSAETANYESVSEGDTGHAESVRVVYDPAKVSYGTLLKVYFAVAHDPTQLDRQGPDVGSQYRSEIFTSTALQARVARAYIAQLTNAHAFESPIVTRVEPMHGFYPAEAYHQDYARKHPDDLYIVINDAPKVAHLRGRFPALYKTR